MTHNNYEGKERRRFKRILFTPDRMIKGVFTVDTDLTRTHSFRIADLGMGGLRFIINRTDAGLIKSQPPIFLLRFEGELNVAFARPVALNIRWIMDQPAFQFLMVGCQFEALDKTAADRLERVLKVEISKFEQGS